MPGSRRSSLGTLKTRKSDVSTVKNRVSVAQPVLTTSKLVRSLNNLVQSLGIKVVESKKPLNRSFDQLYKKK